MELKQAITSRHSIRSFSDKKISLDLIHEMIHYANLAPSAGNLQAREFIIVDDIKIKNKLCKIALDQQFIVEAGRPLSPSEYAVCSRPHRIRQSEVRPLLHP